MTVTVESSHCSNTALMSEVPRMSLDTDQDQDQDKDWESDQEKGQEQNQDQGPGPAATRCRVDSPASAQQTLITRRLKCLCVFVHQ